MSSTKTQSPPFPRLPSFKRLKSPPATARSTTTEVNHVHGSPVLPVRTAHRDSWGRFVDTSLLPNQPVMMRTAPPPLPTQQPQRTRAHTTTSVLDTSGIGDTPVPRQRLPGTQQPHASGSRSSLASLFSTFGQSGRKVFGGQSSTSGAARKMPSLASLRIAAPSPRPSTSTFGGPAGSSASHLPLQTSPLRPSGRQQPPHSAPLEHIPILESPPPPRITKSPSPHLAVPSSSGHSGDGQRFDSSLEDYGGPSHPYASAAPYPLSAPPVKAPPAPWHNGGDGALSPTRARSPAPASAHSLKASASTPNLHPRAASTSPRPPRKESVSRSSMRERKDSKKRAKSKERWLSAETWYDAVLLPRPRFKVVGERLASPALAPSSADASNPWSDPIKGKAPEAPRRGLAKMRSHGSLWAPPAAPVATNDPGPSGTAHGTDEEGNDRVDDRRLPPTLPPLGIRDKKGKRYSWDDMALPSPVPSLMTVLADAERLNADRKQWKHQAQSSIANTRARTVSRTRAKSLSRARKTSDATTAPEPLPPPRAIDRLAERGLLGSQRVAVSVHVRAPSGTHPHHAHSNSGGAGMVSSFATTHRRSHSHGSSNAHTWSSRTGNAREGALAHAARRTAAGAMALCGIAGDGSDFSPATEVPIHASAFGPGGANGYIPDGVLPPPQGIANANANAIANGMTSTGPTGTASHALAMLTPSPTPSGRTGASAESGVMVGVAVSPLVDAELGRGYNGGDAYGEGKPKEADRTTLSPEARAAVAMPGHPFAGLHRRGSEFDLKHGAHHHRGHSRGGSGSQYAGPHPSSVPPLPTSGLDGIAARHRLPPQATLHPHVVHPYAMFGPAGPTGQVREIEPEEMRYSPYVQTPVVADGNMSREQQRAHAYAWRKSLPGDHDALGMGDALTYGLKGKASRDTLLRSLKSDDRLASANVLMVVDDLSPTLPLPVASTNPSRPSNFHLPTSGGTFASTPSEHAVNPPQFRLSDLPPPRAPELMNSPEDSSGSSPSTGGGGRAPSFASSPPHSPRPLGDADDLDRFRDLFYRPSYSRSPSDERMPIYGSDEPASPGSVQGVPNDVTSKSSMDITSKRSLDITAGNTSSAASRMSTLTRQLAADLAELRARHRSGTTGSGTDNHSSFTWSRHLEREFDGVLPDIVLANGEPAMGYAATMPLRVPLERSHGERYPLPAFPQDVGSFASLDIDRTGEGPGQIRRIGTVEVLGTPPPVMSTQRSSSHLSLVDEPLEETDEAGVDDEDREHLSPLSPRPRVTSRSTGSGVGVSSPLSNQTRASYMTTDSRMSALSDFPVPPATDLTPAHMNILHSYFNPTPRFEARNPFAAGATGATTPSPAPIRIPSPTPSPIATTKERAARPSTFGEQDFARVAASPL